VQRTASALGYLLGLEAKGIDAVRDAHHILRSTPRLTPSKNSAIFATNLRQGRFCGSLPGTLSRGVSHVLEPEVNRGLRAFLLLFAFLGLAIVVVGATGWWWWTRHGTGFQADLKEGMAAGMEFGKDADQDACVAESIERSRRSSQDGSEAEHGLRNNFFLAGCLVAAKPSEGFCEEVPTQWNAFAAARWTEQRCAAEGVDSDYCAGMLQAVVNLCQEQAYGISR
jgi:hypothetical protein